VPTGERSAAPRAADGHARDVLLGALSVALFSGFALASRTGLTAAFAPWDLAALRFGVGGLLLLPVLVRHGFANVAPRQAAALALTGGVGFAACAYAGFALAPAAHGAVLLHGTLPLTTYLLARAIGCPVRRNAGLAVIALGVAVIAADGALGGTPEQWLGDGALLLASFSWSAYGLLARRLALRPEHTASIVAVLSMAAALAAFVALPGLRFSPAGWREWLFQALFQGVLIGAVSTYVFTTAIARLGPQRMSALAAAVPCVTTLGAVVVLGESPSLLVLTGVALVTSGVLVSLRRAPSG
jgi:drug/metabolite transporter (DMT)-like permease